MATESQKNRPVALTRLTQKEAKKLDEIAKKYGLTRGKMFRKISREIINNEPDLFNEELQEFRKTVRQLSGIASNLNQLTRAVNSHQVKMISGEEQFEVLKKSVDDLREELNRYIDHTATRWVKGL